MVSQELVTRCERVQGGCLHAEEDLRNTQGHAVAYRATAGGDWLFNFVPAGGRRFVRSDNHLSDRECGATINHEFDHLGDGDLHAERRHRGASRASKSMTVPNSTSSLRKSDSRGLPEMPAPGCRLSSRASRFFRSKVCDRGG